MKSRTRYLVAYDIADPRRLGRVFRHLRKLAFHLQYSVFLANLTQADLKNLIVDIQDIIDPREDDVRIYPLPTDPDWNWLGSAPLPEATIYMEGGASLLPGSRPDTLIQEVLDN